MRKPQRYSVEELNCCFQADMVADDAGEYVSYEDYCRLKAENDQLRKAGDDLDHFLGVLGCTNDKGVRLAWIAAKEGKPSV
jgi:hypothetical protein